MNVPSNSKECPVCGYEFTDGRHKGWKWIAILFVIFFLYLAIRGFLYY